MDPCGKADRPMRVGTLVLLGAPLGAVFGNAIVAPFPEPGGNPALCLMAYHDPAFHKAIAIWHCAAPGIATLLAGSLVLSVRRVWLRLRRRSMRPGKLPPWPVSPADLLPSVVVGELHHPTALLESDEATLTLRDAAKESGYPTAHLGRLVREGKIPTPGRPGAPRIARRHLPKKTGAATPRLASQPPRRDVSTAQIVQSVIDGG